MERSVRFPGRQLGAARRRSEASEASEASELGARSSELSPLSRSVPQYAAQRAGSRTPVRRTSRQVRGGYVAAVVDVVVVVVGRRAIPSTEYRVPSRLTERSRLATRASAAS
ncbi:uncharacterized protein LOC112463316 [Temnothorax curvispinosus]|uniref:Uncharacterized protein LOC112463316 n=1 Tax=Temnothorax curvispinosus TaxID=300111 RepID=A0A6J1QU87_9HYME|nr:uncharacterized protein LOC112463316 [Temnothorax curvispinosus]